eukprot:506447-Pyramimonas_sp.AAC.1
MSCHWRNGVLEKQKKCQQLAAVNGLQSTSQRGGQRTRGRPWPKVDVIAAARQRNNGTSCTGNPGATVDVGSICEQVGLCKRQAPVVALDPLQVRQEVVTWRPPLRERFWQPLPL